MADPYYDEFVRILTDAGASEAEANAHADMWVTAARAAGQRIRLERERDEARALAERYHAEVVRRRGGDVLPDPVEPLPWLSGTSTPKPESG